MFANTAALDINLMHVACMDWSDPDRVTITYLTGAGLQDRVYEGDLAAQLHAAHDQAWASNPANPEAQPQAAPLQRLVHAPAGILG